jgi:hypothetical protein
MVMWIWSISTTFNLHSQKGNAMRCYNYTSSCSKLAVTLILLAHGATPIPLLGQTTFSHETGGGTGIPPLTVVGTRGDLLTEGHPAAPTVAVSYATLGLQPSDEIDALSAGNDGPIKRKHFVVFSVDPEATGVSGSGVRYEHVTGTSGTPQEACGDLFVQDVSGTSNRLARAGLGYRAGSYTGNQSNAVWATPCSTSAADDLDAFDYRDPAALVGVYFSLASGSPSLSMIPASGGHILFSDLSGSTPVVAQLAGGAGPASASNLGIPGEDLNALNVVAIAPGVIRSGTVGATPGSTGAISTHLVEFSVAPGGAFDPGDVLVRVAPATAAVRTPASALGLNAADDLNALEAVPTRYTSFPDDDPRQGETLAMLEASLDGSGTRLELHVTHSVVGATSIRLHNAPEGEDGPVVFDFGIPADDIHSIWYPMASEVEALMNDELYLRITAPQFDQGEIRDQLRPSGFNDTDDDGVMNDFDVCFDVPAPGGVDEEGRPLGDTDNDCDLDLEDFMVFQENFWGPL